MRWLAPLGEEKAEGGAGSKVHFPHGWRRRGGADPLSLMTSGRTQGRRTKLHWGSSGMILGKASSLRGWLVTPIGSSAHGTRSVRCLRQRSWLYGLVLYGPERGRVGPDDSYRSFKT